MASPAASTLPSGITPPLSLISAIDQGGLIAIITAFSIALILISFPIRAYVRSKTGTWKNDDYMFIGAAVRVVGEIMKTLLTLKAGRYSSIRLYFLCSKQRTWQI